MQGLSPLAAPRGATALLLACSGFRTLPEHAARLSGNREEAADAIRTQLDQFARSGLLIREDDLLASIRRGAVEADEPAMIDCVALPTRDRPESLRRALSSLLANAQARTRALNCVVSDDSLDERPVRECVREATRGLPRGTTVVYVGRRERSELVNLLAGRGAAAPDVIRFALFGLTGEPQGITTIGANRNAILLSTAGRLVLSADDDTVCRPSVPRDSDRSGAMALVGEQTVFEHMFFSERAEALDSTEPLECDVVAAHARFLGRRPATLARAAIEAGSLDYEAVCGHLLDALVEGRGRVLLTFNGVVGDSGLLSSQGLLAASSVATHERMKRTEHDLTLALTSREVVRVAPRTAIVHGGPCLATFFGLDNRRTLPPFPPAGRAEDAVFGGLLGKCFRGGFFAHLPFAVSHMPEPRGEYSVTYTEALAHVRLNELLSALCQTCPTVVSHEEPSRALQFVGRWLQEWGNLPAPEFDQRLRAVAWSVANEGALRLERLLRLSEGGPPYWTAALARGLEALRRAVMREDYHVPYDLCLPPPAALEMTRAFVLRFGTLLESWPDIVAAARDLPTD